jgi:SAM-dependent methyltransferase
MFDYYTDNSPIAAVYADAGSVFTDLLSHVFAAGKHVVTVLEVGCGSGMLTEHLIAATKTFPHLFVDYTASDLSHDLARQTTARAGMPPTMRARRFDVSRRSDEQGLLPGTFDIVTAGHVLHAVPNLRESLENMLELLVPGGVLVLIDFDGAAWEQGKPGTLWYDFTFGSFPEWFGFTDSREHCTITADAWITLLHELGCISVTVRPSSQEEDHCVVIIAQKPTDDSPGQIALAGDTQNNIVFHYSHGDESRLRDTIREAGTMQKKALWILCAGSQDVGSAQGLSRSLRQEIADWEVHLVITDASWSDKQRRDALIALQRRPVTELEIRLDILGQQLAPRIIPLSDSDTFLIPFNPLLP